MFSFRHLTCLMITKNTGIYTSLMIRRKIMIKKESTSKTSGEEMFALFALIVLAGCILLV